MKKVLSILAIITSFLSPIELMIIILLFIIAIDTLLKLISIKRQANREQRAFREVFKSNILRTKFLIKSIGYFILAGAIFPLDFYVLTPFVDQIIEFMGYSIELSKIPMAQAIFTNFLLVMFCLMEFSSINENWFEITGNNILSKTKKIVLQLREGLRKTSDFIKNVKQ